MTMRVCPVVTARVCAAVTVGVCQAVSEAKGSGGNNDDQTGLSPATVTRNPERVCGQ